MIRFETYQKIQAHKALGIGQRRTADDLKISLYQVTHWWHKTEDEFHAFEQEHEFMLDNYRSWLLEQIKPFPQIDNTLLFRRLRETFPEVEIPKSSFFRYVKKVREQAGLKKPKREYIFRAAPEPGNQRTKESPRRRFQDEYLSLQMGQRLSIEYELSEYYRDDPTATEFLKQLKLQSPRFCYQQCRRLKKLRQYYTAEELDVAFSHCLCVGICTMLELASYLMYRYGEERIKQCVPETVYISYQKRVRELREESHG